jgi:hypothetical protein
MTNFIGSSREGEERAVEVVEHVDKNQWNGRRVYNMRKNELSNGNSMDSCIASGSVECIVLQKKCIFSEVCNVCAAYTHTYKTPWL